MDHCASTSPKTTLWGSTRAQINLEQKSRGCELEGTQEETQLRVRHVVVPVMLSMVSWAISNMSCTESGRSEPWQHCTFLLPSHTAHCGAMVWMCSDTRDGNCKGCFVLDVVSCLQGCIAHPK